MNQENEKVSDESSGKPKIGDEEKRIEDMEMKTIYKHSESTLKKNKEVNDD